MAYLNDYPKTCRDRATNPEWPLQLLKAIRGEFEKGMATGMFDPVYVLPKIEALHQHVKWCAHMAEAEWSAQFADDEEAA